MGTLALPSASVWCTWEMTAWLLGHLFPSSKPSRFQEQAASGASLHAQGHILPGCPPIWAQKLRFLPSPNPGVELRNRGGF